MRPLCRDPQRESFRQLISEEACYRLLRERRWPDGVVRCPACGQTDVAGPWPTPWEAACYRYRCRACGRSFNDRTGTVFEGSKLPLSAWFLAMYLVELGKTIQEVARELPCDYHTAHRLVWTIRERQMRWEARRRLVGVVEVDEIYQTAGHKGRPPKKAQRTLGRPARRRGKKQGRGRGSAAKDAPALIGMVSRTGEVVLEVAPDVRRVTLEPILRQRVVPGSTVYTDTASCYAFLKRAGYRHATVNHSAQEYVRGEVHTNGVESLWSLWRPFILPFRGVAQRNLPAYARLFQFRRNHRHLNALGRIKLVLEMIVEEARPRAQEAAELSGSSARAWYSHPDNLAVTSIPI